MFVNMKIFRRKCLPLLQQQLISNVNHRNETTYLILFEETLMESIKDVKEITEKITNRIEMSD